MAIEAVIYTFSYTDTDPDADPSFWPIVVVPAGTLIWDVHVRITQAWNDASAWVEFGFNLDTSPGHPFINPDGGVWHAVGVSAEDDNAVVSGNINALYPENALSLGAYSGNPYLPTILLVDATLHGRYRTGGTSPLTQGQAELRVLLQYP